MQSEHRKHSLAARRAIPRSVRKKHSSSITHALRKVPEINNARTLGFYFPMPDEVDILPIQTSALSNNQEFYLPVMTAGTQLEFAPLRVGTLLRSSSLGVQEPVHCANERLKPSQLDTVVVPLVAFDRHCNRIGMGAGYYDRSFSFRLDNNAPAQPFLIGVAFEDQKIDCITSNAWDVPLDLIVTEKRLYQRLQGNSEH